MIYIATNREIKPNITDHEMFGDDFEDNRPELLRFAKATKKSKKHWDLELLGENVDEGVVASDDIFKKLKKRLRIAF